MPSTFTSNGNSLNGAGGITLGIRLPLVTRMLAPTIPVKATRWIIKGVTKDYLGVPLPACTVDCYLSLFSPPVIGSSNPARVPVVQDGMLIPGRYVNSTTSDASGSYRVEVNSLQQNLYGLDASLVGSPTRMGTTINTLQCNLETDK